MTCCSLHPGTRAGAALLAQIREHPELGACLKSSLASIVATHGLSVAEFELLRNLTRGHSGDINEELLDGLLRSELVALLGDTYVVSRQGLLRIAAIDTDRFRLLDELGGVLPNAQPTPAQLANALAIVLSDEAENVCLQHFDARVDGHLE